MKFGHISETGSRTQSGPKNWPPYHLVEESIAARAEHQMSRLERIYHVGQDQVWDGRQVLADLIARHGKPRLPPGKEEATLKILSVLLWGELAAWAISADLAERIDDIDAKMAATSQAHDEARHFYVMRDYLVALGLPVPRLGGIGRRLLLGILETPKLVHKLVGMQLLVESNALAIFRALGEANLDPVLTELLPYYERDEARHVGLGVMYLPLLLRQLTPLEAAGLAAFQLRCLGMLISAGMPMRPYFRALGLEPRQMAERTVKLQDEIMREMARTLDGGDHRRATAGLINPGRGLGPRILDFCHPTEPSPWHQALLDVWARGARLADRVLA